MFKDEDLSKLQMTANFIPAVVLESYFKEKKVFLKIKRNDEEFITTAAVALPNLTKLNPGDNVLAAGENLNSLYVIGILNSSSDEKKTEQFILEDGTYALKENHKIQIFSKFSELIFEYDSLSKTSSVNVQGNLEFITKEGNINFISDNGINFKSYQPINLQSSTEIKLSLIESIGKLLPSLHLRRGNLKISSDRINVTSKLALFNIEELKYVGNKFSAVLKYGKLIAGKIESIANDMLCKAKNIYNNVEELTQIKAKRMRILIQSSIQLKSKNSYLKSDEDFKINAKKIHLG